MKALLQSLVENCIKHGFGQIDHSFAAISPQITVSIQALEGDFILIKVSDNGKGLENRQCLPGIPGCGRQKAFRPAQSFPPPENLLRRAGRHRHLIRL